MHYFVLSSLFAFFLFVAWEWSSLKTASYPSKMRFVGLLGLVLAMPVMIRALSLFSLYDLGFYGVYPANQYATLGGNPSPWVRNDKWDERCESDHENDTVILITPRGVNVPNPGPVILDQRGELVWIEGRFGQAMNLQVRRYKGKDYLTFWSGTSHGASSNGSYYMLDEHYEPAYIVQAAEVSGGDLHEFEITNDGTALITIYQTIELDCTTLGFKDTCWINDCLFQEIDIETNTLLFDWRASDVIPLADSYKSRGSAGEKEEEPYDFFHINSIEKDKWGGYLISSRHMHTIYYVDRNGDIMWTLGGRRSEFKDLSDGRASDFKWQHHARWHNNYTQMSLFDNHGNIAFHSLSSYSRGMLLNIDLGRMTVELVQEYVHPDTILAISQGSTQVLENGNVVVGWGNTPSFTEFSSEGEVLCSFHFGALLFSEIIDFGWVKSYRTFKGRWVGKPKTVPVVKMDGEGVRVSWNGETEVRSWRLERAGKADIEEGDWKQVEVKGRVGFETAFAFGGMGEEGRWLRAVGIDGEGQVLGKSEVVEWIPEPWISIWQLVVFMLGLSVALIVVFTFGSVIRKKYELAAMKAQDKLVSLRESVSSWHRGGEVQQKYELLEAQEEKDDDLEGGYEDGSRLRSPDVVVGSVGG